MTIEERANLSAIVDTAKGRQRDEYYISALADHENGFREGYIKGATDQRAIDIDEACEWLESHFRDIENPDFYSKRNHPTDLESMYHWSVKELVADFRKAMEE